MIQQHKEHGKAMQSGRGNVKSSHSKPPFDQYTTVPDILQGLDNPALNFYNKEKQIRRNSYGKDVSAGR
jgi:hypothetical protein